MIKSSEFIVHYVVVVAYLRVKDEAGALGIVPEGVRLKNWSREFMLGFGV